MKKAAVPQEKHQLKISQTEQLSREEAEKHFAAGGTVAAYWSDYPESGMAYAGEAISHKYGKRKFFSSMEDINTALFYKHHD